MRKNRKIPKKMSVVTSTTLRFGSIVLLFLVMAVFYIFSASSCTQMIKIKGEKNKELARLNDKLRQESFRWGEMLNSSNLERALRRHAMPMKLPRPDQNVHMRLDGSPLPGQTSLARLARNGLMSKQAQVVRRKR